MDYFKRERRVKWFMSSLFVGSILLLTFPTMVAMFYPIDRTLFIILNITGLLAATVRIVLSAATSLATIAIKGESTEFKKSLDKQAKLLFIVVGFAQFLNLAFIHFE